MNIIRTIIFSIFVALLLPSNIFGQSNAQIGNQVWLDNGEIDNQLDFLDNALSGILVSLYDANSEERIDTVRTSAQGRYLFSVVAGDYYLGFELPEDYELVDQNSGNDEAFDSDPDPITGFTEVFSVEANQLYLEFDAGYNDLSTPSTISTEELFMMNNPAFIQYIMDGGSIGEIHNLSMFYRKDTIIGNRKFYQFCTVGFRENQPDNSYLRYLRFQGDRVFMHYYDQLNQSSNGYLILDFGLDLGDSFLSQLGETLTVINKTTIDIGDGIERIWIVLENANNETIEWIQGVGNIDQGFITPLDGTIVLQKTIFEFVCKKDTIGDVYVVDENLCSVMSCKQTSSYFLIDQNLSEVQFINMSDNSASYYWDFGDGQNSTDEAPTHEYENEGCYMVSLTTYDTCGVADVSNGFVSVCTDSSWVFQGPIDELDGIYFNDHHAWYYKEGSLYKSSDNGLSWNLNFEMPLDSNGMRARHINDLIFYDQNNGYFVSSIASLDTLEVGGVFATIDGGNNWTAIEEAPLNVFDIEASNSKELYCLDQVYDMVNGHLINVYHSDNEGQNWNLKNDVDSVNILELFAFENGSLLGVGFGKDATYQDHPVNSAAMVFTSSDYGERFTPKPIPYAFLFSYSYIAGHFFSAEEGFVLLRETENYNVHFLRYDYKLFYTNDGGDSWTDIALPQHLEMFDIVFTDRQNGWITMKDGIILRTIDGGQTWYNEYCTNTQTAFHLSATNAGSVYSNMENNTIFRHEADPDFDCGIVLSESKIEFTVDQKGNMGLLFMDIVLTADVKNIYIEHSVDGKEFKLLSSFDYDFYRNDYTFKHTDLALGSNYYRLYYFDENSIKTYSIIRHISNDSDLEIDISPNPFDENIQVQIGGNYDSEYKVQILDTTAKLVFDNSGLMSRNSVLEISTTTLKSGIYFVSIISDDKQWTKKLIKL